MTALVYRRNRTWFDPWPAKEWRVQHGTVVLPAVRYDVVDRRNSRIVMVLDHHREINGFLAGREKRAYRLAELAVGNKDDALDIVQDAMFCLVERYGKCPPAEWGPLFRTILHSRIQDWHRRESVRRRFRTWFAWSGDEDDPDPLQQVADEQNPGPDQSLLNRRSMDVLGRELRKLPARQQQAFMLRILEGLDVSATAMLMHCSAGSVKTHLSRAVHTLRAKLEDYRS